ncbi:hypothetical protein [Nocardioides sp.]|uniref:hypothetical protein n=1 Tax=Nocardioides sp. TaxID=35761 RepID=UPI0039E70C7B
MNTRTALAAHALDRAAYRLACDVADDGNVWTPQGTAWPTRAELIEAFRAARREWIAATDAEQNDPNDPTE